MKRFAPFLVLAPLLAVSAVPAAAQPAASAIPTLEPHRAVYEISLAGSRNRGGGASGQGISGATGRIVYEFSGNACDGYTLNFRQVTQLSDPDGQNRLMDLRSATWEESAGREFRFSTHSLMNNNTVRRAEGNASRSADGSISVSLKQPRDGKLDLDGDAIFPTEHMRRLIQAARQGERTLQVRVFDGSEGGEKVYDTVAAIGRQIDEADRNRLEPVLASSAQAKVRRWPVSITYFEEGKGDRTPAYVLKFVMFDNGVSSDISFEFSDFTLQAKISRFEPLKKDACER